MCENVVRIEHLLSEDPALVEDGIRSIGVNAEFLDRLNTADDWSAVILGSALIEATLTEAVCIKLVEDNIKEVIRAMPLNGRASKVEMAVKLGVLSEPEVRFIRAFSEIRNRFAHGIQSFKLTLAAFLAGAKNPEKYLDSLIFSDHEFKDGTKITFRSDPRLIVMANVLSICLTAIAMAAYDEDSEAQDRYESMYD